MRDTQCKTFNISLKWNKCVFGFYMCYITSKPSQCIKNWNEEIGSKSNRQTSVGIYVHFCSSYFFLFDKDNAWQQLSYKSPQDFKQGDIFTMSFNFEDKKFIIFHNGKITSPKSTMQAPGTRVKHLLKTALLFHQTLLMGVAHDQFQLFSIGFNTVAPVIVTH